MNKLIKILGIVVGIIVLAILIMGIFQICPPQGSWPMPPWCEGGGKQIEISKQPPISTSPYTIAFTAKVPENTPKHTVVYLQIITDTNEWVQAPKMEKIAENTWYYRFDLKDFKDQEIHYRYMRDSWGFSAAEEFLPDSKTASRTVLVEENPKEVKDVVEKWRWLPKEGYVMSTILTSAWEITFVPRINNEEYQKGALIADFWWGNFKDLLDVTHQRLKEKGFRWIEIAPNWNYKQINPLPVFSNDYTDEGLEFQLKKMKNDGFKVFIAAQLCCADTSKASFSKEWWDAWFAEYEKFVMYFTEKANKYDVEMLDVTADWIVTGIEPSKRPSDYKERLEAIYQKAKDRYHGKLARSIFLGGAIDKGIPDLWPKADNLPFMEKADLFTINWWVGLTDKNNPTQEELDSNVKRIFDSKLNLLYQKYQKPVVLKQVAYPSIDGGLQGKAGVDDPATAMWEPYSDKYTLDLEEQAMAFEAVMKNVAENANYIVGVYPFTYWPDEFPLSKEYNIRGKPAEEVLSKWYASIK